MTRDQMTPQQSNETKNPGKCEQPPQQPLTFPQSKSIVSNVSISPNAGLVRVPVGPFLSPQLTT
jgi:hypothetical protein